MAGAGVAGAGACPPGATGAAGCGAVGAGDGLPVKTRFRKSSGAELVSGTAGGVAATGTGAGDVDGMDVGIGAGAGAGVVTETGAGGSAGEATSGMRWLSHGEPGSVFLRKKLNMDGSGVSKRCGDLGSTFAAGGQHAMLNGQGRRARCKPERSFSTLCRQPLPLQPKARI
jgi:hypothetical protein